MNALSKYHHFCSLRISSNLSESVSTTFTDVTVNNSFVYLSQVAGMSYPSGMRVLALGLLLALISVSLSSAIPKPNEKDGEQKNRVFDKVS